MILANENYDHLRPGPVGIVHGVAFHENFGEHREGVFVKVPGDPKAGKMSNRTFGGISCMAMHIKSAVHF